MGIYIIINLLGALPINIRRLAIFFKTGRKSHLSEHDAGGHDDDHVGHKPLEEQAYCEWHVIY